MKAPQRHLNSQQLEIDRAQRALDALRRPMRAALVAVVLLAVLVLADSALSAATGLPEVLARAHAERAM